MSCVVGRLGTENADLLSLTPGVNGSEDPVPDTGLLAVVHTGLAIEMVVGVVLNGQLHTEWLQESTEDGVRPVSPDTRVAKSLDVESVANDEPHLDEAHLGRNGSGEEWYDKDLEDFLVVIGQD